MNSALIDRLLVFYLSPAIAFFIAISRITPLLYFVTGYVTAYLLILLIIIKILGKKEMNIGYLMPLVITALICSIEYFNYLDKGIAFGGMTDIRMVVYSPLFSSIYVFSFYATYLMLSTNSVRRLHLQHAVQLFTYFNAYFALHWVLVFSGVFPNLENHALLNANSISYGGVFVVFVLLVYRGVVNIKRGCLPIYLFVNTVVIFLNTTRGAMLVLLAIVAFLLAQKIWCKVTAPLFLLVFALIGIALTIAVLSTGVLESFLGESTFDMLGAVFEMTNSLELGDAYLDFERADVYDDASVSSVGRILANYVALVFLSDYPIMGIGSAYAYNIDVVGAGIHSFNFLYLASTGLMGVFLFANLIRYIAKNIGKTRLGFLSVFFGISVFMFTNAIPPYFVLLFIAAHLYWLKHCDDKVPNSEPEFSGVPAT